MWLFLCERNDLPALWAYRGLQARGLPLELITAEVLARALGWEHRLGKGSTSIRIELADGRVIIGDAVRGVLNRLVNLPVDQFALAAAADREYASQEFHALFLSWLHSLPGRVVNRPTPQGLCGPWLHRSEWLALAAQAGLVTVPYRRLSGDPPDELGTAWVLAPPHPAARSVMIVSGTVLGDVPSTIADGCRRLAQLADVELLGLEFRADPRSPWTFSGATPLPDLSSGGDSVLTVLDSALRGEG